MSESGRRGAAPHEGLQMWVSGAASWPAKSSLLLAVVFRLRLHLLDDRDVGKSSAEGALGRRAQLAWWTVAAPPPWVQWSSLHTAFLCQHLVPVRYVWLSAWDLTAAACI